MQLAKCVPKYQTSFFQDPKSLPPGLPASLMNMINKSVAGGKVNEGRTDSPKQQKVDTETPQQKQAAAKLALRKQLEKTLLQVRLEDLHVYIKLMRFEVPNGIVDDSDSDSK